MTVALTVGFWLIKDGLVKQHGEHITSILYEYRIGLL